jgi:membrane protease YdiL (CAAX protease family)
MASRSSSSAAPARWWRPVIGAGACTVLYLAATVSSFLLAELGGRNVVAAVVAMAVIVVLCLAAVRLSAALAYPPGRVPAAVIGRAPSRRVASSVSAQLVFLIVLSPVLISLGHAIGLHGSTNVPLHHKAAATVLVLSWIAIAVAPWMEEISMRGFLLSGLWARFGFWPAAIASSLVWAGLHGVSGVLIPFAAEGIVLCWIRRRTGSIRTGIALHAAQNTVASLASGAGLLAVPPAIAVVVSLVATKAGRPTAVGMLAERAIRWTTRTADSVAATPARQPLLPSLWIFAGCGLTAGVVLEGAWLELGLGGDGLLTVGRVVIVTTCLPALAWLLLSARASWRAPAVACLAGAAGCAVVAASRTGVVFGSTALVPLVGVGYTLLGLGLVALATTRVDLRARIGAAAAGLLLTATLTPLPYLVTSPVRVFDQSLATSLAAAAALISVGLVLRRPARSAAVAGSRYDLPLVDRL